MKTKFYYVFIIVLFTLSCTRVSTSPTTDLIQPDCLTIFQSAITQFKLTWIDNSIDEVGYMVQRKLDNGEWNIIAQLPENAEYYLDDILISRQTFDNVSYRICSYEGNNNSDFAEVATNIEFSAPTDLELNMIYWYITWTDNSFGEEGFVIERSINGGEYIEIETTVPNQSGTLIFDLDEYNIYAYRVYAFVGDFHSDYSNLIQFTTTPDYFEADFVGTPLTGSSPLIVQFTDISIVYFPQIITWEWDFGNGQTLSLKNPNALYLGSGVYTVSLTVTNEDLQQDTLTKVDYITVD
ncbi:MAG: PKD domain-containing protein [Candidatus Tenebribacter burtonii]|nr:PKD domain-containing protein [Candidatus Tenebribacter burtonii]